MGAGVVGAVCVASCGTARAAAPSPAPRTRESTYVLAALVLVVASTSALKSGPYLPSGWKPEGPAFYLPSEVQKPAAPRDIVFEESEGSSSDFLREYGPPKEDVVSQNLKTQSLPEVATDQPFIVLDAKFGQDEAISVEAATEVVAALKTEVVEEDTAVESETDEKATTETVQEVIQGKSLNLEVEASVEDNAVESEVVAAVSVNEEASVSAKIESDVQEEVKIVEKGVRNIAEAIVNLEKEVVAEQVQISQDVTELKTVVQASGSVDQVPEGFLEYGPPGFREYGPPNHDALQRSEVEEKSTLEEITSNETRRRQFSPKFRSSKSKH